ncbi:MAG: hypothetical protein F9K46_03675 [Anaerolineae bacterium]|nr:MAG: hypothetical protein F9K46_03675 [Anaerolineae bacterium]
MYSDDPAGNKPDMMQGGELIPDALTQRLKTIWKKYPLVSIFVFVVFIGCSVCMILTYRIFHDLSNDFTIHVSGDLDQKLEDGYTRFYMLTPIVKTTKRQDLARQDLR